MRHNHSTMFIGVQVGSVHSFNVFLPIGFAFLPLSVFFFPSVFFMMLPPFFAVFFPCNNNLRQTAFYHNRSTSDYSLRQGMN